MNGRLYDPLLHRFLQPDNFVQDPYFTQSYNRYAYVWNNPLAYIDPTGMTTQDEIDDAIRQGLSGKNGGYWTEGSRYQDFGSQGEAFAAAESYNNLFNSWGSSAAGSAENAWFNFSHNLAADAPGGRNNGTAYVPGSVLLNEVPLVSPGRNHHATRDQYLATWAFEAAALENFAGKTRLSNWGKLYFENPATGRVFMGNQYIKTLNLAKIGKGLGIAGAAVGMTIDAVGVVKGDVHPAKFGADAVMTGIGIWGGPIGSGASVLYFGVDAYAPGFWPGAGAFIEDMQRENAAHANDLMWHIH